MHLSKKKKNSAKIITQQILVLILIQTESTVVIVPSNSYANLLLFLHFDMNRNIFHSTLKVQIKNLITSSKASFIWLVWEIWRLSAKKN